MSTPPKNRGNYNEKEVAISRNLLILGAPAGIELLNLWNDFRKIVKFIDENPWVKPMLERIVENKKTEGWDSQSCDSVFITTSDTPISSVMTADFLYPTKAKACVRSYFDKHRVNHLDSHPDLSAISSLNHGWLFCSVKNYWKEVVGIVPDVLRYAIPLFGYG